MVWTPLGHHSKPHRPCSCSCWSEWAQRGRTSPGAPLPDRRRVATTGVREGCSCSGQGPGLWERTGEIFRDLDFSLPWALNAQKNVVRRIPYVLEPFRLLVLHRGVLTRSSLRVWAVVEMPGGLCPPLRPP